MEISLQTQIHIVVGTLGGVIIILITWLAVFCCMFDRLKKKVDNLRNDASNGRVGTSGGQQNYAYNEADIRTGEELSRRGYAKYEGPIVAPRLQSTGNGMYGAPRSYNPSPVPPADYSNDMANSKDASKDFVLNKRNPPDYDVYRPKQVNGKNVSATVQSLENSNPKQQQQQQQQPQYNNPARASQFNTNILLGKVPANVGNSNSYTDDERQFYNNRAMNY